MVTPIGIDTIGWSKTPHVQTLNIKESLENATIYADAKKANSGKNQNKMDFHNGPEKKPGTWFSFMKALL